MAKQVPFVIIFAPEVAPHLEAIDRKYHLLIHKTINDQLEHAPLDETRNRKPLAPPGILGGNWELRLGPQNRFRVIYEVNRKEKIVRIVAIGVKDGNRLNVAGEEYQP
ncbi:MAG TPA: type II toxin-antitoxin system RelE/ParE family toxin [Pirellulaceae bacterium]|nr:type II toxin-antitoxin system RelE/ParE family toxin [Pirellulaceae bacterium]